MSISALKYHYYWSLPWIDVSANLGTMFLPWALQRSDGYHSVEERILAYILVDQ